MNAQQHALVSVVTPVYNGEAYLRECIESVLRQTYQHWEYVIVNNFSSDGTLEIAEEYRRRDGRIRVYSNDRLLPIIANHNKAFSLISPDSKYCKVVSADDWLFPECLARMVELAESNPSVGLVGSYQLSGGEGQWYLRNAGLSYYQTVVSGQDVCRSQLLGKLSVFGNPTSTLYRADLVRGTSEFYPNATAEADTSACFKHLQQADFGFVHQVLSHERLHRVRETTASLERNAYLSAAIGDCITYGDFYLTRAEADARIKELLNAYYRYLSINALKFKGRGFWDYHSGRLQELGFPLDVLRLSKGISMKLVDLVLSPKETAQLVIGRMRLRALSGGDVRARQGG
jgi:glycosyltransferase involved in cell wall biosynthesis